MNNGILFRIIIAVPMLAFPVSACQSGNGPESGSKTGYNLSSPDKKFELPGKLTEISGISAMSNNKVACEQDEEGKIYVYDLEKNDVLETIDFGKKGDYEGIALVKDDAFILRSDGVLFKVNNWRSAAPETVEFTTLLSAKNDAEGLCYDSKENRLLIACKGKAGEGDNYKRQKAVYAFDLSSEKLKEQPVILLDIKQLKEALKTSSAGQIAEFLSEEEDGSAFQPSEIAIHPVTGNIYILSSGGKALLTLNRAGEIVHLEKLDAAQFKQPEGLTFFSNGDMLISNEGQGGTANMLLFKYAK